MRPTRNIDIQKPDIIKNHHLKKKHPYNHTWTLQVWCQMNGKEGAIKQPLIFQGFFHHPLEGSGPQAPETSHPPWCRAEVVPSAHLHFAGRLEGWRVDMGGWWLDLSMAGAGCWIPTPSNKGCLPKKKKKLPWPETNMFAPENGPGPKREIHVTKTSIFR